MDDPIFDGEGSEGGEEPATPEPKAPPAPPAPTPDPQADARLNRLEGMVSELVTSLKQAASTPMPEAPAPPRPANERVNEFVTDPDGYINRIASETAQRLVAEAVNPVVMQTLDVSAQQLLGAHAVDVDTRFGTGTWAEMFQPQLEQDLGRLREVNPRALADKGTIDALVSRLYGGANFDRLVERRGKAAEAAAAAEEAGLAKIVSRIPGGVPGGGIPRVRQGAEGELPEGVETFLKETDKETGTTTNRKHFAKLLNAGTENPGGRRVTTVVDYLQAVGASPDTQKHYGGN